MQTQTAPFHFLRSSDSQQATRRDSLRPTNTCGITMTQVKSFVGVIKVSTGIQWIVAFIIFIVALGCDRTLISFLSKFARPRGLGQNRNWHWKCRTMNLHLRVGVRSVTARNYHIAGLCSMYRALKRLPITDVTVVAFGDDFDVLQLGNFT